MAAAAELQVGARMLDLVFVRDRASRRETKLLNVLLMIKSTLWKGRSLICPMLLLLSYSA